MVNQTICTTRKEKQSGPMRMKTKNKVGELSVFIKKTEMFSHFKVIDIVLALVLVTMFVLAQHFYGLPPFLMMVLSISTGLIIYRMRKPF